MNTRNPQLTKEWSTGWWPFKRYIKVVAEQVDMPPEYGGMAATAKVTIFKDDKVVHVAEAPWGMPKADIMLVLQVYMLAKQPEYEYPEWQPIMERFCTMVDGFEPPTQMYWSREPFLD